MPKPTEGTYIVTVIMRGVSKKDAMAAAEDIKLAAFFGTDNVEVLTAHLKDES